MNSCRYNNNSFAVAGPYSEAVEQLLAEL